jgi:mono/diheme cytochrome c family protein
MAQRRIPSCLGALLAIAATVAAGSAAAAERGDAAMGEKLAERWCLSCHSAQARGADTAPPLPQLMRGRGDDTARLRGWLAAPHPPMQGIDLSRQQTEDIVAWLRRLGRS